MKKLVTTILSAFALAFLPLGIAMAAAPTNWVFNVSDPSDTTDNKSVVIEYKILASKSPLEEEDDGYDEFTVELSYKGEVVETREINDGPGATGTFKFDLDAGTHTFVLTASDDDGETTSEERTVVVSEAPVAPVRTVVRTTYVNNGAATNTNTSSDVASSGVVDSAAATTTGQDVQGATIDESAQNTSTAASTTNTNKTVDGSNAWMWAIPGIVVIAGAAYYWFFYRLGKGPFTPGE